MSYLTNNVAKATLRLTRDDEKIEGTEEPTIWQKINSYLKPYINSWGDHCISAPDALLWHAPFPVRAAHTVSYLTNYDPARGFIHDLPSTKATYHRITGEEKVLAAFFKEPRNGELFEPSMFVEELYKIACAAFPESKFTKNDFIFSANREENRLYRKLILHPLNGISSLTLIEEEAKNFLKEWTKSCRETGKPINASQQFRLFSAKIITKILLGAETPSEQLCSSINFINQYIMRAICKTVTQNDQKQLLEALTAFKKASNKVLTEQKAIPLFSDNSVELTLEQKQGLIFAVFFAGQEPLSAFFTYLFWQLAKDIDLQEELYSQRNQDSFPSKKEVFFNQCLKEFPPATGVTRKIKEDLCLEYQLTNETDPRKFFMKKGDFIVARIIDVAAKADVSKAYRQWYPFGGGGHSCPGEKIVLAAVTIFLNAFIDEYVVDTEQVDPIKKQSFFTMQLAEDILLTFSEREEENELVQPTDNDAMTELDPHFIPLF